MLRSSNHAVPSPGSSAPKLMFFTLTSTGSSMVYCAQSVEPVTPRVCMLSNARTPAGPSTRHHRPAYPRVTPSVLMKPLYRTFFPAARAIGKEAVATPNAGPPRAGDACVAAVAASVTDDTYAGSYVATNVRTFSAATVGVCMSNPVNWTGPLPDALNVRIHRIMANTSSVSHVQKYIPRSSDAGSPVPFNT